MIYEDSSAIGPGIFGGDLTYSPSGTPRGGTVPLNAPQPQSSLGLLNPFDWLEGVAGGIEDAVRGAYGLVDFAVGDALPDYKKNLIADADTTVGKLVQGAVGFLVPYVGVVGKVGRAGTVLAPHLAKSLATSKAGRVFARLSKEAAAGGIVDFTFRDPYGASLSQLIQSNPDLANPLTAALSVDASDNEIEARLKGVLEGGLLGIAAEPFLAGVAKAAKIVRSPHQGLVDNLLHDQRRSRTFVPVGETAPSADAAPRIPILNDANEVPVAGAEDVVSNPGSAGIRDAIASLPGFNPQTAPWTSRAVEALSPYLGDVSLSVDRSVAGEGAFNLRDRTIRISHETVEQGRFDAVALHEVSHAVGRHLSDQQVVGISREFVRARDNFFRDNPWAREALEQVSATWDEGAPAMTPAQWAETPIGRRQAKAGVESTQRSLREAAKFLSLDEWWADTATAESVRRLASLDAIEGAKGVSKALFSVREWSRQILRGISAKFGGDYTETVAARFLDRHANPILSADHAASSAALESSLESRAASLLGDEGAALGLGPRVDAGELYSRDPDLRRRRASIIQAGQEATEREVSAMRRAGRSEADVQAFRAEQSRRTILRANAVVAPRNPGEPIRWEDVQTDLSRVLAREGVTDDAAVGRTVEGLRAALRGTAGEGESGILAVRNASRDILRDVRLGIDLDVAVRRSWGDISRLATRDDIITLSREFRDSRERFLASNPDAADYLNATSDDDAFRALQRLRATHGDKATEIIQAAEKVRTLDDFAIGGEHSVSHLSGAVGAIRTAADAISPVSSTFREQDPIVAMHLDRRDELVLDDAVVTPDSYALSRRAEGLVGGNRGGSPVDEASDIDPTSARADAGGGGADEPPRTASGGDEFFDPDGKPEGWSDEAWAEAQARASTFETKLRYDSYEEAMGDLETLWELWQRGAARYSRVRPRDVEFPDAAGIDGIAAVDEWASFESFLWRSTGMNMTRFDGRELDATVTRMGELLASFLGNNMKNRTVSMDRYAAQSLAELRKMGFGNNGEDNLDMLRRMANGDAATQRELGRRAVAYRWVIAKASEDFGNKLLDYDLSDPAQAAAVFTDLLPQWRSMGEAVLSVNRNLGEIGRNLRAQGSRWNASQFNLETPNPRSTTRESDVQAPQRPQPEAGAPNSDRDINRERLNRVTDDGARDPLEEMISRMGREKILQNLRELQGEVRRMRESGQEPTWQLINHMVAARQEGRIWDAVTTFHAANILSGPVTQIANVSGSMLTAVARPLANILAMQGRRLFSSGEQAEVLTREITSRVAELQHLFTGFREAAKYARDAGAANRPILDPQLTRDGVPQDLNYPIRSDNFGVESESAFGRLIDGMGAVLKIPFQGLTAGDEMMKQIIFRARLRGNLTRQGLEEGVERLDEFVENGLRSGTVGGEALSPITIWRQAEQEVGLQGISDPRARFEAAEARAQEILAERRSLVENSEEALKYTRESTFTNQLPKGMWRSGQALINQAPVLKLFIPFFRTPVNLIRFAFGRSVTPVAASVKMAVAHGNSLLRNKRLATFSNALPEGAQLRGMDAIIADLTSGDPVRSSNAMMKMTVAYGTIATVAGATLSGVVTGRGPQDPERRQALMDAGWRPYSFRVGDTYVSYQRFDPLATMLGLTADMVDYAMVEGEQTDPMWETALSALATSFANNATNKTFLSGVDALSEVLSDPTKGIPTAAKNFGGAAVPLSSFWNQTRHMWGTVLGGEQDNLKEIRGIMDAMMNRVPGLAGQESKRNIVGEKIKRLRALGGEQTGGLLDAIVPVSVGHVTDDPIARELARLEHGFQPPSPEMGFVDLRDVQAREGQSAYDRWQELTGEVRLQGRTARQALERLISSRDYQALPAESALGVDSPRIGAIRSVLSRYRRKAWEKLTGEVPTLRQFKEVQREVQSQLRRGVDRRDSLEQFLAL